jgi:hypothetical protein
MHTGRPPLKEGIMTTTTMISNGRARKSLADQIDRLDGILDGLADALNMAVAQAVKEAVEVAVKAALAETLAHPALRSRLASAPAVEQGPRPSALKRLLAATRRTFSRVTAGVGRFGPWVFGAVCSLPATTRKIAGASCRLARTVLRQLSAAVRRLAGLTWRLRGPVLVALSVGGVVAWGCYVAGPLIASTIGGLAGAAETLSARARWLQGRPMAAGGASK